MDCKYLKALSDMFESTEIQNFDEVATQNKGETSSSLSHKQINACDKSSDINQSITSNPEQEAVQVDSLAGGNPSDNKICPSIEFTYSQDLRVQDIFLPHSSRTPSSYSCEWLIATVNMPAEIGSIKEIEADIVNRRLIVSSPKYFLDVYLPQPPTENQDSHGAKWDCDKKQLVVHVKLER